MSCTHLAGGIVVCRGPKLERHATEIQRSAAWCERCKRRRVQTLIIMWPAMSDDMAEADLLAAAMWGPVCHWACPCGGKMPAPGYGDGW